MYTSASVIYFWACSRCPRVRQMAHNFRPGDSVAWIPPDLPDGWRLIVGHALLCPDHTVQTRVDGVDVEP
jgi:hypothetical protein